MKTKNIFLLAAINLLLLVQTAQAKEQTTTEQDTALGQPGLAFSYASTIGTTGRPYIADGDHLNEPYGIGVDNSGNVWVAEWAGARAVKYGGTVAYPILRRGSVILVRYPFTDLSGAKVRPAVILALLNKSI